LFKSIFRDYAVDEGGSPIEMSISSAVNM